VERSVRAVAVGRQQLRVAVRPGDGTRAPLLLVNGIGASLELLQPFVDALDPSIEVIRFDVPEVGGSPLPRRPYRLPTLARLVARLLDQLGHPTVDMLGISWEAAWPSSSRCAIATAVDGWSWSPPARGC
jgi:pimeloyl-ACP methyl ester carboxylesterase